METILHIGLSNALVAVFFALGASVLGWICWRPALLHRVWLLVLGKLVTPPLVLLPLLPTLTAVKTTQPTAAADQAEHSDASEETGWVGPADVDWRNDLPALPATWPANLESLPPGAAASSAFWTRCGLAGWLAGALGWWGLAGYRIARFQRLLTHAELAPDAVQARAERLAAACRLRRCPAVWFMPGAVSPMLWAFAGRPRLLVPTRLWQPLTPDQQDTLLAHELAHYCRRDHWVRWLELIVLGLYWWHPVVWWARRQLRECEEQCCDSWVVWLLPEAASAYAAALVEALAFVSQHRLSEALPASGMGQLHLVRRRLVMIMRGTAPRTLSWVGLFVVLGLAGLLLPVLPTWARTSWLWGPALEPPAAAAAEADPTTVEPVADPTSTTSTETGSQEPATQPGSDSTNVWVERSQNLFRTRRAADRAAEQEKLRDEIELLEVQLEVKRAQFEAAKINVESAQRQVERLEELAKKGVVDQQSLEKARHEAGAQLAQWRVQHAELKEPELRLMQARRRMKRLMEDPPAAPASQSRAPAERPAPESRSRNQAQGSATSSDDRVLLEKRLVELAERNHNRDATQQALEMELKKRAREEASLRERLEVLEKRAREAEANREELARARKLAEALAQKVEFEHAQLEAERARLENMVKGNQAKLDAAQERAKVAQEELRKLREWAAVTSDFGKPRPADAAKADAARLQDLEKKMDKLIREIESLRKAVGSQQSQQPAQSKYVN